MNIYFLFIACLQLSPILAPVNPATTWVPLTLIFAISAFKEAIDDYYRYKGDKDANTRKYWILSPVAGGKIQIAAEDIRVGDLIYLRENDEVPCDLVILKTADAETHCAYVQTANLDGETDLKTRNAVRATAIMSEEELLNLRGTIECATPNAEIYKFDSRLKITSDFNFGNGDSDDSPPSTGRGTNVSNTSKGIRQSADPRYGHRRAASSGRALPITDDSAAPLAPQHPVLPRRTISGNLAASFPSGHRRARSLGGHAALHDATSSTLDPTQDETSPYYIPARKSNANDCEADANGDSTIPLDPSHTAWQATTIRNVAWVVGVVVYTGNETKVGMNKSIPPSKWTKVDMIVNRATIAVFVLQIVLTLLLGATGDFWLVYNAKRHWYLQEETKLKWFNWLVIPLRFLLLMSLMIPISLKVTLDAVKYIYALLIDWDMDMVDPETGTAANCHSSALSEDLGQIDYIFSDKTGTLTENVMVFAQCSINHMIYDGSNENGEMPDFSDEDEEVSLSDPTADDNDDDDVESPQKSKKKKKKKVKEQDSEGKKKDAPKPKKKRRPTAATDPKLKALLALRNPLAYDFCRILALCNTAMPTTNEDDCIVWKCASPDEEALVVAAAELGFTLKSSRSDQLVLEIDPIGPSYSEKLALAAKKSKSLDQSSEDSINKVKKTGFDAIGNSESKDGNKTSGTGKRSSSSAMKKKKKKPSVASASASQGSGELAGESSEDDEVVIAAAVTATEPHQESMTHKFKKFMKIGSKTEESKKSADVVVVTTSNADQIEADLEEANQPSSSSPPISPAEEEKKKKKKRVRIAVAEDDTEVIIPEEDSDFEEEDDGSPHTTEKYTVLHILEFTSDRKRMSVLLRSHTTNQLVLLMKGADDKVLAALAPHQHKKDIVADVEHFAQLGLRTLCLCQRIVSETEYTKWSIRLNKAATSMKDREALMADAYAEIEKDFQFVGITAIEDKLQQGVPETIELLRRAGIKIWMLTGDKLATAVQIATSCNLISPTSVLAGEVFTIEGKTFDTALASLNATIAKVLPLTRGMGATNTASSTGVRLNSYFDQPQAYKYQHLALKTAAQVDDEEDDEHIVDMERTLGYQDDTDVEEGRVPLVSDRESPRGNLLQSSNRSSKRNSMVSEDTLRDLKLAIGEGSQKGGGGGDESSTSTSSEDKPGSPPTNSAASPNSTVGSVIINVLVNGEALSPARDTITSDYEDDTSSTASQSSMAIKMKTRRRYPSNTIHQDDSANDSRFFSDDGSVMVEDDEHQVEFQAQQYYQQYHDQQFHRPSMNPNTKLMPHRTMAGVATGTGGKRELSLVVEGSTLTHLLRPACKARFLQLALEAHTVICCRVTPQQKAQVVELVKHGVSGVAGGKQERTTLAIGDGGNDVSMIQAASVGIGLVGREGLQAARASDFSLAKFRFLAKLILVHGRWSYRRTAFVAHYCFHKSLFLAFMQIFYAFFSGFAGTSLFDSFALASYNVAFTGLPIMFYSLDKDINEQNLLLNPQLYHETQSGRFINTFTLLYWFVRSFAQSALVFFCVIMLGHDRTTNGFSSDWISTSSMAFGACVVVQCLTVFLESNQLTFINHIVIWGTLGLYFTNMMVIDVLIPSFNGVIFGLFSDPVFWFGLFLAVSAAILPIVALRFIMITWFPTRSQLVQRMESLDITEYEEFAQSEQRRRQARASYIQESHQVASLIKKKASTTNFLTGTIYRFQNATIGKKRDHSSSPSNPHVDNQDSKHPSTLHRTTPVTPDVLSEDEEGVTASPTSPNKGRSRTNSDVTNGNDTGFESDHIVTMGRLMDSGTHSDTGVKASIKLRPEIVDPNTFLSASPKELPHGSPTHIASSSSSSSPPPPSSSSPHTETLGVRTGYKGKKGGSVDRSMSPSSEYGYGPKYPQPPRRLRAGSSERPPSQSTNAIMRDPSSSTAWGSGEVSPPTYLANMMPRSSNPALSYSESSLPALLPDGTTTSASPPSQRKGSRPQPSTSTSPKKNNSLRKGSITGSTGSLGGSNKISPIPSLSLRPQYSIEAGHAGTLQVVPLHMIGRSKAGLSTSTNTGIAVRPDDDWNEQPDNNMRTTASSSFSQLPAFNPSGSSGSIPRDIGKGGGGGGGVPSGNSKKRARSISHNPRGGTASGALSSTSPGSLVLPSSTSSGATPPSASTSSLPPPSSMVTATTTSPSAASLATASSSTSSSVATGTRSNTSTPEPSSFSAATTDATSSTSSRTSPNIVVPSSSESNDSEASLPKSPHSPPQTKVKTKIKVSNSSISSE
jgi:magnesium-transporting ATPase (P-type)